MNAPLPTYNAVVSPVTLTGNVLVGHEFIQRVFV